MTPEQKNSDRKARILHLIGKTVLEYRNLPAVPMYEKRRAAVSTDKPNIKGAIIARPSHGKTDIFVIAQQTFGQAFDREKMTLHGHYIRLDDLMRKVNKVRLAAGRPQVLYNPNWEVE